jgi:hypothetical protein
LQDEDYSQYQRRQSPHPPVLTQRSYQMSISLGFLVWALIIYCLVFVIGVPAALRRDDFGGIAQTAANLSAICLAVLTFVHVLSTKNHYLKLALAVLSLDFVLATSFSMLVLATSDITSEAPFRQTLTVAIMTGILAGAGIVGVIGASTEWRISITRRSGRFPFKMALTKPKVRFNRRLLDYSAFAAPFGVALFWVNPIGHKLRVGRICQIE